MFGLDISPTLEERERNKTRYISESCTRYQIFIAASIKINKVNHYIKMQGFFLYIFFISTYMHRENLPFLYYSTAFLIGFYFLTDFNFNTEGIRMPFNINSDMRKCKLFVFVCWNNWLCRINLWNNEREFR